MSSSVATYSLSLAILAFLSTTLDDFSVVLIFFGKEYVKTHNVYDVSTCNAFISIIVGQIIGFTLIVGISLCIGIGLRESISSDEYIDLVGFVPILIGVYKIHQILDEDEYYSACCVYCGCSAAKTETDGETPAVEGGENAPLIIKAEPSATLIEEGKSDQAEKEKPVNSTQYVNLKETFELKKTEDGDLKGAEPEPTELEVVEAPVKVRGYFYCTNPLVEEVAMYALLFGVDNIVIYVSLLCSLSNVEILTAIVVFYLLLLTYLGIAIAIITQV